MLSLKNISYYYKLGSHRIDVLENVTHTFEEGSFTSICAPSGSGKTTLLNLLGLLDRPVRGHYLIDELDTGRMKDAQKSDLRAKMFGFLFQNFRLIPTRNVLENVALSLDISGVKDKKVQRNMALAALEQVGLDARASHLPPELSGGEAQRVAFARALAKHPKVLLADEPTGNLDVGNRDHILSLISEFHQTGGTVIMVTHDHIAASRAERILALNVTKLMEQEHSEAIGLYAAAV